LLKIRKFKCCKPVVFLIRISPMTKRLICLDFPLKVALVLLFLFAPPIFGEDELVFWNFWDPKFILPVIQKFEALHPGIKIRNEQLNWGNGLDKIVVAHANKRAPDICELGSTWTGKFMSEGALIDLTEKVRDLSDKLAMWEPATWNGKIYGVPWLVGTRVLFFNKALFRESGLSPQNPPETWDDLINCAQKIHNPKNGIYGIGINAGEGHILYKKFLPFVWGNGGRILDETGKFVFDSLETKEALSFYQRLMVYGLKEKQDILDDAFKRGKLGMEISGSWNFARYPKEAPNLEYDVALIPRPGKNKGHTSSFLGGEILVLFKGCKNPDMAAEFLKFITKAEYALPITKEALVSFPASKEAFSDPFFSADPRFAIFIKQMETAVHPPVHPLWIELESIINDAVEKVLYGGDIDAGLKNATLAYEKISKQYQDRKNGNAYSESTSSGNKSESGETLGFVSSPLSIFLLAAVSLGTLFNAILLLLIYGEVKKNVG